MNFSQRTTAGSIFLVLILLMSLAAPSRAMPGMRLGLRGVRMEPEGSDAEKFSEASWGGGLVFLLVPPRTSNLLAGVLGFDVVVMLSQTTEFRDALTGLRVEQQTNQDYFRIFLGGRLGHQGHGFFRPYAEGNLAVVHYNINTDVVIPDDEDREKEIRQHLSGEGNTSFGYDLTLGLELNFKDIVFLDVGAKYLRCFSVPQQLGEDSVEIHPRYFQFFAGLNIGINRASELSQAGD